LNDTVATIWQSAAICTGIAVDAIAVIARLYADPDNAITTGGACTAGQTIVAIEGIAVIARFYPNEHHSIATTRGQTRAQTCIGIT
jgi:hypothetical protein